MEEQQPFKNGQKQSDFEVGRVEVPVDLGLWTGGTLQRIILE